MNGILCVDKPEGWTSFDVAAKLRGVLGIRKIGHGGTLDPMATGVLPIFVGRATRVCDIVSNTDKTYRAGVKLGIRTDTLDTTGIVLDTRDVDVSYDDFSSVLSSFVGEIEQIPPMYSAVKIDGVKLYKLARQGIEVKRPSRKVTIYSAQVLGFLQDENEYTIDVNCSSGTYVRTLCDDIGEKLGCFAAMSKLRRTVAGVFNETDAVSIEHIADMVSQNRVCEILHPIDSVLGGYERVDISTSLYKKFINGVMVECPMEIKDGRVRVYYQDKFLGLGEKCEGMLKAKKILTD